MTFDYSLLETRLSEDSTPRPSDYRGAYFRERARLVHSAAFRRLQGKTQVLGLGDSDFYRTRLTHSMEVASLSQSISKKLTYDLLNESNSIERLSPDERNDLKALIEVDDYEHLLESIGFAHDIGHPAFGHGGERALFNCLKNNNCGFEGNAQTLRILTTLSEYDRDSSLNPTLRLALGVLKYPISYEDAIRGKELGKFVKPPKCAYQEDLDLIKSALNAIHDIPKKDIESFFNTDQKEHQEDSKLPVIQRKLETKYIKSLNKSFDCSVMELADDISYALHDLEDSCAIGLLKSSDFCLEQLQKLLNTLDGDIRSAKDIVSSLTSGDKYKRKSAITHLIKIMIDGVYVYSKPHFAYGLFKFNVKLTPESEAVKGFFGKAVVDNVIKNPKVQQLERKGEMMVEHLYEALSKYNNLLEKKHQDRITEASNVSEHEKLKVMNRLISDYISGMTDNYASKLYKSIFIPDEGSVFDRL